MPPPKKTTRFSEEVKNRPMTEIHEPDLSSLLESPTESFEKSRNQGDIQISGIHLVCFEGKIFLQRYTARCYLTRLYDLGWNVE